MKNRKRLITKKINVTKFFELMYSGYFGQDKLELEWTFLFLVDDLAL